MRCLPNTAGLGEAHDERNPTNPNHMQAEMGVGRIRAYATHTHTHTQTTHSCNTPYNEEVAGTKGARKEVAGQNTTNWHLQRSQRATPRRALLNRLCTVDPPRLAPAPWKGSAALRGLLNRLGVRAPAAALQPFQKKRHIRSKHALQPPLACSEQPIFRLRAR